MAKKRSASKKVKKAKAQAKQIVPEKKASKAVRSSVILQSVMELLQSFKYKRMKVKLKDIDCDRYQRDLSPSRVDLISGCFIDILAGYLSVSRRKGRLFIIDGNHRVHGMLAAGIESWEAHVFDGMSVDEEALLFVALNRFSKQPTSSEVFHAALIGKEPTARGINRLLKQHGLEVPEQPTVNGTAINCVTALEAIYTKEGGPQILGETLSVITSAWYEGEARRVSASIIKGMARLLFTGQISSDKHKQRLITQLEQVTPKSLLRNADAMKDTLPSYLKGSAVMQAIIRQYNKGLRSGRIKVLPE
jgi:hypothetical protein